MPVYEYLCEDCGYFEELRPMSESGAPCNCPECGNLAEKIMSAPRLAILAPHMRKAHETNERSQHAPKVNNGHTCSGSGCSHQSHGKNKNTNVVRDKEGNVKYKALGGVRRPWMISH